MTAVLRRLWACARLQPDRRCSTVLGARSEADNSIGAALDVITERRRPELCHPLEVTNVEGDLHDAAGHVELRARASSCCKHTPTLAPRIGSAINHTTHRPATH